jgi:hypothetical protein
MAHISHSNSKKDRDRLKKTAKFKAAWSPKDSKWKTTIGIRSTGKISISMVSVRSKKMLLNVAGPMGKYTLRWVRKPNLDEVTIDEGSEYWHIRALATLGLTNVAKAFCGEAQVKDFNLVTAIGIVWEPQPLIDSHIQIESAVGDGTPTSCPPEFQKVVFQMVNKLKQSPSGALLLKNLKKNTVVIRYRQGCAAAAPVKSKPGRAVLDLDPKKLNNSKYVGVDRDRKLKKDQPQPDWIVLAHELVHVSHIMNSPDAYGDSNKYPLDRGWDNKEEQLTISGYLNDPQIGPENYSESTFLKEDGKLPRWSHSSAITGGNPSEDEMVKYYGPGWLDRLFS